MKRFLSILLTLALLLGSVSFAMAEEPTVVRIVWWGSQGRHDLTVKALEKFMEKNPDIKVEYEFADWGGYWSKLATQVAGGMIPDVIQMGDGYIQQYAQNGVLENLTPYAESGKLDLSNISDSAVSAGAVLDGVYGIPTGLSSKGLIYRKDVLDQAGVTMPMEPTWGDIFEIARKVYEVTGRIASEHPGASYGDGLRCLIRSYGLELYNEDGTGFGFDDPKYIAQHWNIICQGQKEGWVRQPGTGTAVGSGTEFIEDSWMSCGIPVNQIGMYETGSNCELAIAMLPKPDDATAPGMWVEPTMYWSMSAKSQVKDAALRLINYLNHDTDCADILGMDRGTSVSTELLAYLTPNLDSASAKMAEFMAYIAQDGKTRAVAPLPTVHSELEALYGQYMELVKYGLVDDLTAHAQAFMDEAADVFARVAAEK